MSKQEPAKVLLIDDEQSILQSVGAYLEDSGFIIATAENGEEGIAKFEEMQPDLVLTDIHMPIQSGLEVLAKVRKANTETPVLVISGAGQLNDAIEALRLGAWDYITKPVSDLEVLEHALNKALERRNLLRENREYAAKIAENLKELQADQKAGRQMQMSMLPVKDFKAENFVFSHQIQPSLELSGDFVDYFRLSPDYCVAYIADVSGHGASSAFITVLLKSLITRFRLNYENSNDDTIIHPAKLVASLSEEIYQTKLNKYLTLVYGVLDLKAQNFSYCIAGHYPSPIIKQPGAAPRFLEGRGFPVGVSPGASYEVVQQKLEPGTELIMFSDGIMELLGQDAGLEVNEQKLLEIIAANGADVAAILQASSDNHAEALQNPLDDITVLTIQNN